MKRLARRRRRKRKGGRNKRDGRREGGREEGRKIISKSRMFINTRCYIASSPPISPRVPRCVSVWDDFLAAT